MAKLPGQTPAPTKKQVKGAKKKKPLYQSAADRTMDAISKLNPFD